MSEQFDIESLKKAFKNIDLFNRALTHSSFTNEERKIVSKSKEINNSDSHSNNEVYSADNNEKLEFLGDAVLDLILSEFLMELYPENREGELSKKRASLVNESVLAEIAIKLQLDKHLKLGKGELLTGGIKKPRLLASAFEAVIGALYLDSDFIQAKHWVKGVYNNHLLNIKSVDDLSTDYKTQLQELVQAETKELPTYTLVNEEGPSHDPQFEVEVRAQGKILSKAKGRSKKIAEQNAAYSAIDTWKRTTNDK